MKQKHLQIFSALIISLFIISGCGRPKAADQSAGTIAVPDFPASSDQSLGLKSVDADKSKTYTGQLLIWNLNAKADTVSKVVKTLASSNRPLINKYTFMKNDLFPRLDRHEKQQAQKRVLASNADPRFALRSERLLIAESWFDKKIQEITIEDHEKTKVDERKDFIDLSKARFQQYCEAKIWERVFKKPYVDVEYKQRPTPSAICEPVYQRLGLMDEASALCSPNAEGKNFAECFWFEGVLKTQTFASKWYGDQSAVSEKIKKSSTFDKLLKMARNSDSVTDVTDALLRGEEIRNAEGQLVIEAISANNRRFEDFAYKKCRRYRPGCTASISVGAGKLQNLINYIETDHQILLFSEALRGSNGIGEMAKFNFEGNSANESIFNDALAADFDDEDDLNKLDDIGSSMFGESYPPSKIDEQAVKALGDLENELQSDLKEIEVVSEKLIKSREEACKIEGNFYCPIQDSTNSSLQIAVQPEVSSGMFRSVTLKLSQESRESGVYHLQFGFTEKHLQPLCLAAGGGTSLVPFNQTAECQQGPFEGLEFSADSGAISFEIAKLTPEILSQLGLQVENERPVKVDLFDKDSRVTEIDFNDNPVEKLAGHKLQVSLLPYKVEGLFEKISGEFKIIHAVSGETIAIGNISLRETEQSNPFDLRWTEFQEKYLSLQAL
ncbi:hypothetical protein N9D31_01575 [Oligoflexaceae bacterium]|nr:hypothetical protein [Oligoflexaceae bacterium]